MSHDTLLNLGAFVLQVFVIVAVAAACLRALRIASAGARYVCWRVVLCACLAMPVVLHKTVTVRPLQTTTGVTSESAFVGGFRATDFVATPTAT